MKVLPVICIRACREWWSAGKMLKTPGKRKLAGKKA
jgi:hypothetical protein